jgi:hypothetical protein
MSTQPAPEPKAEEQEGSNVGKQGSPATERAAIMSTALKLTKTKELFFHFEIGFKRTAPASNSRAGEVQAPQGEQAVSQPVLTFPAAAPRQAAAALDGAVAPSAGSGSGSSGSGGAVYVLLKGGTSQTPPDGYPPPP